MTQRSLISSESYQCRICLQTQQLDKLISPCECRGSIKYVHLSCLQLYFSHRFKAANINQRGMMKEKLQCEICKFQINCLKIEFSLRCTTVDQLANKLKRQDICFLFIFILLYIGIHVIGVILLIQDSLITKIVGGAWLLLATIAFNYGLYIIIRNLCLVHEIIVSLITTT